MFLLVGVRRGVNGQPKRSFTLVRDLPCGGTVRLLGTLEGLGIVDPLCRSRSSPIVGLLRDFAGEGESGGVGQSAPRLREDRGELPRIRFCDSADGASGGRVLLDCYRDCEENF